MSLDRRLRDELRREADRIDGDVERHLGAVEARAHRSASVGWPTVLVATAVVALAIGIRLGAPTSPPSGASPAPSPTASGPGASPAASFDAIAGTYVVTLDASDPVVAKNGMAGTWTMRLAADGEIFLSPPASFGSGTSSLSGLAFSLEADRFRSNLIYNDFCGSIGTYTWALQAGTLSFAPIDDACQVRRALLSSGPWHVGP
jgi:hypothetical protein